MKILNYAIVASAALFLSGACANAAIINFDAQGLTGPSTASVNAAAVTVSAGGDTVTFNNGAILTNATNAPADETSVYFNSFFLGGTTGPAMTIAFSAPITNFFLDLYNGETYPDTFTVSDNLGKSTTVTIDSNTSGGTSLISFPAIGNIVTITTSDPNYDFFIDNIGFNQATPSVPEPATWAMMLAGLGLVGHALRKRSSIRGNVAYG